MTWGFLLVLLGFLDSRSQEGPIGIGTGAQVGYGFQHFSLQKGGRETSNIKQTTWVYRLRSISSFEVLEGGEGNSFADRGMMVLRLCKGDEELRGAMVC